jgi:SAM-dependent methyltransferase
MTTSFSVPADWYKAFFSDPVVRFWDAVIPPQATQADVAFIMRHVGVVPPSTIADIACGTGRHAIALAKAGFEVTAIDASPAALKIGHAAACHGLPPNFQRSDMLKFKLAAPVDALICMGNSIGYFEPALTRKLLRRFAAALRDGGRLILDTGICAESLLPIAPERRLTFPGGYYDQEIHYDARESLINTRAHLTIDAESHELKYRHYVMTCGELVRMLGAVGFKVLALHADTDDSAFVMGSPRLLIVAVKHAR